MAEGTDSRHGTSDEYHDPYCDICCETKNLRNKAEGYYHDCYHCLCKDCLMVHSRLPATRLHVIRTGEDMPQSQADKPPKFEYCGVHQSHLKVMLCTWHRVLLCTSCVPSHHQGCPVQSVEDVAKKVPSSEVGLLYDTVDDFKTHLLSAESRIERNVTDLREQRNKILTVIQEIYDKIVSKIYKLFQNIKSDLDTKYRSQSSALAQAQKKIRDVIENLESTLNNIRALKRNIVDTKVFLKIQDVLKSIDLIKKDASTLNQATTRKMLRFVPDKMIDKFVMSSFEMGAILLSKSDHGEATSIPEIVFPVSTTKLSQASVTSCKTIRKKKSVSEVKAQKRMKYIIRLLDDKTVCHITGIAITWDGRRLLADFWNKNIKMFSRDMKVISSLTMPAGPWNIVVTGDKEAVVSVPDEAMLVILNIFDKQMTVRRTVELSFRVFGIATYQDKLVVTSETESPSSFSVKLIDQKGSVYWSTSTDQQGQELLCGWGRYVSNFDDGMSSVVIIPDGENDTLTLLNSNTGDVISSRPVDGKEPYSVTTDIAGNIYVCYYWAGEVAGLSKDVSEEKILLTQYDGLGLCPLAIAYDPENHRFLVSYNTRDSHSYLDSFQLL